MRKFLVPMFMVALLASPAFAAVQNIKVSGDIDSTFLHREDFNLGTDPGGPAGTYNQDLFLTQTRLRVDADLSDNVGATIALINERTWNNEGDANVTNGEDIDINLAFVQLREFLYSPLSVTVGRQQFNYGNAFIIGAGGSNNSTNNGGLNNVAEDLTKRTAYDGVKMVFDYNPLTIDLFAAKVDANNVMGTGDQKDDVDLVGLNANYQLGDEMGTTLEAYFFARLDRTANLAATGAKTDTIYVPGLRASTNPIKGLNIQGEVALQRGNDAIADSTTPTTPDNADREAFGAQAIINYALPLEETAQWNPVMTGVYTYVSGDSNGSDAYYSNQASENVSQAWDPMFEDQAGGTIYNSLFNLSNAHIVMLSAQVNPIEDVTTKLVWTGLWTASESDFSTSSLTVFPLVQPDGSSGANSNARVTSNRAIGQEVDAVVTYAYTEDVKLGLNVGMFVPGDFFDSANNEIAKQALANVGVAF